MTNKDHTKHRTLVFRLGVATALIFAFFCTSALYFLEERPKPNDWLGFGGSIIGGMITMIGAAFAWRAVQLQLSLQHRAVYLALVSREEDRLEKTIDASLAFFMHIRRVFQDVSSKTDPVAILESLRQHGYEHGHNVYTDLNNKFGAADRISRGLIGWCIAEVINQANEAKSAKGRMEDIGAYTIRLREIAEQANSRIKELDDEMQRLYRRLNSLRADIDSTMLKSEYLEK